MFKPIRETTFRSTAHTDPSCAICMENFQAEKGIFTHDGNGDAPHMFHLECIQFWTERSATCPTCRLDITHVNGKPVQTNNRNLVDSAAIQELHGIIQEQYRTHRERALRAEALYDAAAMQGDLTQVEGMLPGGFSLEELVTAAWRALKNGHEDVANAIMSHYDGNEEAIGVTIRVVISENYIQGERFAENELLEQFINPLLTSGGISVSDRSIAVLSAIENEYFQIATILINNGQLTCEARENAIIIASEFGNLPAVNALLQNGEISKDILRTSILSALLPAPYIDIVEALISSESFSQRERENIMRLARNDHELLYRTLVHKNDG